MAPLDLRGWRAAIFCFPSLYRSMLRYRSHIFWLLLTLGVLLRTWHFLTPRAFWLDEAMLAINVIERAAAELMQPLDYYQSAPLGWLWVQKAMCLVFGPLEWGLRLWPLCVSLLTLPLLYRLYRIWRGPAVALIGLGLAVFTYILIFYSAEAKPYQTDVLASTLLLLALQSSYSGSWRGLGLAGLLLPWLSLPAVLVMAPVGLVWLWNRRAQGLTLRPVWGIGGLWLLSAGLHLWLRPQSEAGLAFMQVFWQGDMLRSIWRDGDGWYWLAVHGLDPFESWTSGSLCLGMGLACLTTLGAWRHLSERDGRSWVLVLGPLLLAALLSAFGLYALRGRLLLFALPGLWLWVSVGTDWLRQRLPGQWSWGLVWLIWIAVAWPPLSEMARTGNLGPRENLPAALQWVCGRHQAGQTVYVHHASEPAARVYASRILTSNISWQAGNCYMTRWDGCFRPLCLNRLYADNWRLTRGDLDQLHGEVWVLFAHVPPTNVAGFDRADALMSHYVQRRGGRQIQQRNFQEARAILYALP